jgi:Flp pilus assembly protein TadG
MSRAYRFLKEDRGASTVEFVLVMPLLAVLLMGTIYTCFMMYATATLHYTVESAARCYAVNYVFGANAARCGTAAATQAYALSTYRGPGMTPALTTASFLVTDDATCNGKKVSVVNAGYRLRTGIMTVSVPISASACFPI